MDGVELIGPRRPPLSRETRLLLITILLSIGALSVLARIRFADRPGPQNSIAPVLTQLGPPPVFDQLSSALVQVQTQLTQLLIGIDARSPTSFVPETVAALRLDAETAVAVLGEAAITDDTDLTPAVKVVARDPATGLAVLRTLTPVMPDERVLTPALWSPRRPASSRYLVAAEVSSAGVSGRPVFVGALEAIASPVWAEMVWALPAGTDLPVGAFVFTIEGALAGLVADVDGGRVLVPGAVLRDAVDRLRGGADRNYGQLGIEVQPLTPGVASGTGAQTGVVVTWVDPQGSAAGQLDVADVIEAVDNDSPLTYEDWRARATRLTVGQTISLRVKRRNEVHSVTLTASRPAAPQLPRELGLTMRAVQTTGAEVLRVDPASAAALAGIQPGDVITVIGDRKAPTPAEVRRRFAAAELDRPVLVAVTRGTVHRVLTLQKR
jgi:S1-C subfamily serine protease